MQGKSYSRREFLKIGGTLAAAAGLPAFAAERFAAGLEKLARGLPRVFWLQAMACSGCTVSMLNSEKPTILQALIEQMCLVFHPTLSAAQGNLVWQLFDRVEKGREPFILVLEGAIPSAMPEACTIGGRRLADVLDPLLRRAKFALAAGTCAAFGGVPAAEGNVTGAIGLQQYVKKLRISAPGFVVNCPGCPCHPDAILGTLAYLAEQGYPDVQLDVLTPDLYYSRSVHDSCPRAGDYRMCNFAKQFSDAEGCLFELGCAGLMTIGECPSHRWNSGVNWCVDASAPCIGCMRPEFARLKGLPLYQKPDPV